MQPIPFAPAPLIEPPKLQPKRPVKKVTDRMTDQIIAGLKRDKRNYAVIKQMIKEKWEISVPNWERIEKTLETIF